MHGFELQALEAKRLYGMVPHYTNDDDNNLIINHWPFFVIHVPIL